VPFAPFEIDDHRSAGGRESGHRRGRACGAVYNVVLDRHATSCDCPGFAFTGGCLHASALLALQAKGRVA